MRILIILFLLVAAGFHDNVISAGKKPAKELAAEDWYVYSFHFQDGYRTSMTSACKKSYVSPAVAGEEKEKRRINYDIIEQATYNGKPVVVDVQTIDVREKVYIPTEIHVITDRFVRGKETCNIVRDNDLSGELNKDRLERYR